jgi:hypothetical protein
MPTMVNQNMAGIQRTLAFLPLSAGGGSEDPARMMLLLLVLALMGLSLISYRWGADSRDGRDWTPAPVPSRYSGRERG